MNRGDLALRYPKLLIPLNVILACAVLIFVLLLARSILSVGYKKNIKLSSQSRPVPQKLTKGLYEYAGILEHNPFGFQAGQLKELSVSKEGPVSRIDLTLVGTVAGPSGRSYAIFADKNGKQEVVKVGERIFGGGRLKAVDKDRAIIREGGRETRIPIAEIVTVKEVSSSEGVSGTSEFARNIGRGTYILDQKKVLNALDNPNQLMTDARLQPNFVNGKQEGFTLREVRSGGIYQSLGLQNGDVLLRINDYNISNPETSLQAFTALRGMDRVQVDLVRNGAKMTMTYQIR